MEIARGIFTRHGTRSQSSERKVGFQSEAQLNGDISRFKARWVVQGYLEQYGIDLDQTYAAVFKTMAL